MNKIIPLIPPCCFVSGSIIGFIVNCLVLASKLNPPSIEFKVLQLICSLFFTIGSFAILSLVVKDTYCHRNYDVVDGAKIERNNNN